MSHAKVEIAFGIDPFDSAALAIGGNWVDVTASVRSAQYATSRRSDRFGVFAGGQASIVLNDRDREMDPSYASSTYVNDFKRSTPIRITGTHSATPYVQWFGYARLWTPSYTGKDAVTTVAAVDALGLLSRYTLATVAAEQWGGDGCGARIDRVLDEIGFPSGATWRDLDTGSANLVATLGGANALQHLATVAASDTGFVYAQRDGVLTFDGRAALTTTRQTTSQATFSHDTTPTYLLDTLQRSGVGEGFRNLVRIGGTGVTTATVDKTAANEAPIVYERTDLLMDSDAHASGAANFYADLYSAETPSMTGATFLAAAVSDAAYNSELFPRKLRDRVTVEHDPVGPGGDLSDQCFIDGISGQIGPARWDITYLLSSADAYDNNLSAAPSTWMVLGTETTSQLGVGKLGY